MTLRNIVLCGDALECLKTLPDDLVDTCITSPPYYNLRDYGGINNQLGAEDNVNDYVNKLCNIFDEVHRVLKSGGTCWVNIGDTYIKGCLVGAPALFQLEMIRRGWILRNVIIWHKTSCIPSAAKNRFTVDFEYIFFFAKHFKNYYFEQQIEPYKSVPKTFHLDDCTYKSEQDYLSAKSQDYNSTKNRILKSMYNGKGRNKRCVWSICPNKEKSNHFATYPDRLIRTPMMAACPEGGIILDPFFGSGTTGLEAKKQGKYYIGIDLNPDYVKLSTERLKG